MSYSAQTNGDLLIDLEVDSFCHGLRAFPGKLSKELVHRVLKELKPALRTAFEQLECFDLLAVSRRLSDAAHFTLNEKEVVFFLSLLFPLPEQLDEESQCCMATVLDKADQKFPTLLNDLEVVWKNDREVQMKKALSAFAKRQESATQGVRL